MSCRPPRACPGEGQGQADSGAARHRRLLPRLRKAKGHSDQGRFRAARVEWTISYDPDKGTRHLNPAYAKPDWAKEFDVIVHDECCADVVDLELINRILEPHRQGLPGVVLHCGMHSYRSKGFPTDDPLVRVHRPGLRPAMAPSSRSPLPSRTRKARSPRGWRTGRPSTRNYTTTSPASCWTPARPLARRAGQRRQRRRLDEHVQGENEGFRHDARSQQRHGRRRPLPRSGHARLAVVGGQAQRLLLDPGKVTR